MSARSLFVRGVRSLRGVKPELAVRVAGLALVVACASSPAGSGPATDAGVDARTGAGYGEVCVDNDDCTSLLCHDGQCNRECNFDCPEGQACRTVQLDGFDHRLCVAAADTFCDTCQSDEDCGDDSDACVQLTAGKFCALDCLADATVCPAGFSCQIIASSGDTTKRQCLPINGVCCVDADGDRHGVGGGCLDADCDDAEPEVYVGHQEVCDALDNDCAGGVDDHPLDCNGPLCELGALGYFQRIGDVCPGAAGCQQQPATMCGRYTCAGGGEVGDVCATTCEVEVDDRCVPTAHCDGSACLADLADGQACDEGSDCAGGHCQNGFCCAFGDCCQAAMDCPTYGTFAPVCDASPTCQGGRGEAICTTGFTCGVQNGVPDDSACGPTTVANECGWWRPIRCTGAVTQPPPSCPTTCATHADCDDGGWCDPVSDTCREDLDDGQTCGVDEDRCKSGHCQNGFCCAGGDCCATAGDCPGRYAAPAVCTSPTACDGEADVATCTTSVCGTAADIDDDSACGAGTSASDCGPYQPVFCTGSSTQTAPQCATSCTGDGECDSNAYCNPQGQCVPDQPDGGVCQDAGECQGGHCQNGFCCASGDCCAQATDCAAYSTAPVCQAPSSCQGSRVDGVCAPTKQCGTTPVFDDAGCAGIEASSCGPYPSQVCTVMTTQPPPTCATSCTTDAGCDVSAHCTGGVCVPDQGPGGFCEMSQECSSGLTCVDNVCCNRACNGSCEACDLPGSVGTCAAVASGQDPDNECGGLSCAGYYHGFSGDSCRRKADVPANVAACNGALACRSAAVECGATPVAGPVTLTCNDVCQNPASGTCTGTVAGSCTNVNPGTQTCGVGQCLREAPICANGGPAACVAGAPTTETCNDLDDNCDGTTDNGAFSDAYEPNPDCSSARALGGVGSDGTNSYTSMTIYAAGDHDYYAIPMAESDSSCGCGSISFDEDYLASVSLTVPVGAGSFELCMDTNSCGFGNCVEIGAGGTGTVSQWLDGQCLVGTTDRYTVNVRVRGDNAPAFECRPYTLGYTFDAGHCR